jgi:hypothetical protein
MKNSCGGFSVILVMLSMVLSMAAVAVVTQGGSGAWSKVLARRNIDTALKRASQEAAAMSQLWVNKGLLVVAGDKFVPGARYRNGESPTHVLQDGILIYESCEGKERKLEAIVSMALVPIACDSVETKIQVVSHKSQSRIFVARLTSAAAKKQKVPSAYTAYAEIEY